MSEHTGCVIIGGGPAGMMAGLLLARAGIAVTVLEKHPDFLRDFRGDTVHPSTLMLLDELGLGERFAAIAHSEVTAVGFPTDDGGMMKLADMSRLAGAHPYIAMVPQWDFLDLLAAAGAQEPTFTPRMSTEVTGLIREQGRVSGVRYRTRNDGTDTAGAQSDRPRRAATSPRAISTGSTRSMVSGRGHGAGRRRFPRHPRRVRPAPARAPTRAGQDLLNWIAPTPNAARHPRSLSRVGTVRGLHPAAS